MSRLLSRSLVVAAFALALLPGSAYASLTTFVTYSGNVGYSSDGFGSTSQSGTISADVPVGATVLAAYLWTASNDISGGLTGDGTLNGIDVNYGAAVVHDSGFLASQRADVTAIVKPIIDGGPGGVYNFAVTETDGGQDGEALVVIYSLASLPVATIGILDGFSSFDGDSATINFGSPLAAGFFAEMIIGDNFSCCGQASTISVNGTTITENAGNFDDGDAAANGALISVGGFNDPYSAFLPGYDTDHEKYDLAPQLALGDTSATIRTLNPSQDDNIFMALFKVSGEATIVTGVPDGGDTMLLLGVALALTCAVSYRRA